MSECFTKIEIPYRVTKEDIEAIMKKRIEEEWGTSLMFFDWENEKPINETLKATIFKPVKL